MGVIVQTPTCMSSLCLIEIHIIMCCTWNILMGSWQIFIIAASELAKTLHVYTGNFTALKQIVANVTVTIATSAPTVTIQATISHESWEFLDLAYSSIICHIQKRLRHFFIYFGAFSFVEVLFVEIFIELYISRIVAFHERLHEDLTSIATGTGRHISSSALKATHIVTGITGCRYHTLIIFLALAVVQIK